MRSNGPDLNFTDYALYRMGQHGLTERLVTVALLKEYRREEQADGRVRVFGFCPAFKSGKVIRVVLEPNGSTVMNAMPDRNETKRYLNR